MFQWHISLNPGSSTLYECDKDAVSYQWGELYGSHWYEFLFKKSTHICSNMSHNAPQLLACRLTAVKSTFPTQSLWSHYSLCHVCVLTSVYDEPYSILAERVIKWNHHHRICVASQLWDDPLQSNRTKIQINEYNLRSDFILHLKTSITLSSYT